MTTTAAESLRWGELFAGIGGFHEALAGLQGAAGQVVRAVDHDEACHATYVVNHGDHAVRRNLDSIRPDLLCDLDAWWLSPPCQPYTVRGRRRDLDDPRACSLVRVMGLVGRLRPQVLAMENVPGFSGSRAHALVRHTLRDAGYHVHELLLCPADLGVAMRRPRWYLIADQRPLALRPLIARSHPRLRDVVDDEPAPELWADASLRERYEGKLAVADASDPDAVVHVFTGAYGVSPVYSGSWLATPTGPRRFSPQEMLRLMGFPEGFRLVAPSAKKAYKLVGNSLSVDAVRALLEAWL